MKQLLANHLKNIQGKKLNKKLLAFAVDDYGNVRLHSRDAREKLESAGVNLMNRFDQFDALDTTDDYHALYETLANVKDLYGRHPIFTTYAMSCNIDFRQTLIENRYVSQTLQDTYSELALTDEAFKGAYELLLEGIDQKFLKPQFHGREHLNIKLLNELLQQKDIFLIKNLELKSLAGIQPIDKWPTIQFNEAFSFWDEADIEHHKEILRDGLKVFKQQYGYASTTFTPPALQLHPSLITYVSTLGINGVDKNRKGNVHTGFGKYITERNQLADQEVDGTIKVVRNCVFEPNDRDLSWADYTFKQIEAAFFWGKPAIVSSHRVNFCGHIDESNRKKGLEELQKLLSKVVKRWPEIEFVSVDEIVNMYQIK